MTKEFYWSITLESAWVQAAIWTIENEKTQVYSVSSSVAWDGETSFVEAVDSVLSEAIEDFPADAKEPKGTVFGVGLSWVEDGQIKREFLDKIKKLCTKLDLTPTGFVVLPEAISYYFKSTEGSPLSGVVMGVGAKSIDVALFKLGNYVGGSSVSRSVSLKDDVVEGLVRLAQKEPLPSRFVIYNGKDEDLEEAKQMLVSVDWGTYSQLKFLHTPQVEVLSPNNKMLAVCLAGASETAKVTGVQEVKGELVAAEVGFSDTTVSAEVSEPSIEKRKVVKDILEKIKMAVSNVKIEIKIPKIGGGKGALFVGLGVLIIFMILGFVGWWFLPKATAVVYISPRSLKKSEAVILDPGEGQTTIAKGILPARVISETVSSSKTASATGANVVGDKATGKIQIRNGTSDDINLPSGTVVGSGNLKFITSESASVSAAVSPLSPGTVTINVKAKEIGAEYNLSDGEVFSVSNYPKSDMDGVAEGDFSGGSSRETLAVSETDRENLEEELIEELKRDGEDRLVGSIGINEIFVEETVSEEVENRDFSHKAGDETDSFELSMDLKVSGLVVDKSDVNELLVEVLANEVPQGYILREEQVKVEFVSLSEVDGLYEGKMVVDANLLPQIDTDEIVKKIAGKYPPLAEEYLTSIAGFVRAEVTIKPKFPGKLGTIPRVYKNISIEVSSER